MEDLIKNLNMLLSDLNVFYRKLQNFHWNVKGNDFFVLHPKLEEYYDSINDQIDQIAEHILVLNGQPMGSLKDYLDNTKIVEAENAKVKSEIIYKQLATDYSTLLQDAKKIKTSADSINEHKTSSLMDDLIEHYSENIWMIKQSMV